MVNKIDAAQLIRELREKDLINGFSTPPGRVRTFLLNPEKRTTPHSCSLRVYDNNLGKLLSYISQDLRGGSGVKVILDEYRKNSPKVNIPVLKFFLNREHADYNKIKDSIYKDYYIEEEEILKTDILIKVADSMEYGDQENLSIEDSWKKLIELCFSLDSNNRIIINLSKLRECGKTNAVGLTSTGPIGYGKDDKNNINNRDKSSFTDIYISIYNYINKGKIEDFLILLGTINSTIRRGGTYKNGIITSSMRYDNKNIYEYLDIPIVKLPGSHKKGISLRAESFINKKLIEKVIYSINTESLFLSKIKEIDKDKDALSIPHANVCMGIFLSDADTCLIWRTNMAKYNEPEDFITGISEATEDCIKLLVSWREVCGIERVKRIYLPLEKCKQVAIDVMGLANALAKWNISYAEFVPALEFIVQYNSPLNIDSLDPLDLNIKNNDKLFRLIKSLAKGYQKSTEIADSMMNSYGLKALDRLHTIEPAQSHSFEIPGEFTTCRGIWPPPGRRVRRVSETQRNKIYYHGPVETSLDIGPELYQRLCIAWQSLMNIYGGRPHAISYDLWKEADEKWLSEFMNSSLQTKYYSFSRQANQTGVIKASLANSEEDDKNDFIEVGNKEECAVCAE